MKLTHCFKIGFATICAIFSLNAYASFSSDMSDVGINTQINAKIIANGKLSVFKVDVSTHNGYVKLSGTVDSDAAAADLIKIAQRTDGVKGVDVSGLRIRNGSHPVTQPKK